MIQNKGIEFCTKFFLWNLHYDWREFEITFSEKVHFLFDNQS